MNRDRTFPPSILRWSELKHMARSPAHFRAAYESPRDASPAMILGWMVHHHLLGGDRVTIYDGERRGNAWKDFKEAHPDTEIVTIGEYNKAKAIADAVRAHPFASIVLDDGDKERELAWTGPLGHKFAGRLDMIRPNGDLAELKVTTNTEPSKFAWQSLRMGYHAQAALYREGARENGFDVERFWMVSVEAAPPHTVTERALLAGQKLIRLWVERVDACQREGIWPGYVQTVVPLDIPDESVELTLDGETIAA